MDSSFKTSDISKKILETRKQTEELKEQLKNLIESGINSSTEYKSISHCHLDKENITESQNKVQIIKSYDTAHSQHVIKASSSQVNLTDNKKDPKHRPQSKKTKNYDVNKTREYMKKQREKRLEEQKLEIEKKMQLELQKKKLLDLKKKSLELVRKNVQAKRQRSKSREPIDFVRPIKDISKSRSSSQERDCIRRNKRSSENSNKRGKSVERINTIRLDDTPINPNLLYPPLPHYLLNTHQPKKQLNQNLEKFLTDTGNEIIIISGNSSDQVKSPKSVPKRVMKTLKPKNLFDVTKVAEEMTITNTNLPNSSEEMHTIRGNDIQKKNSLKKLENGIEQKSCKPTNLSELSRERDKMLVFKNIHNKNISSTCLHSPENSNLISTNLNINNNNNTVKPKLSEVAIGTDTLEKITKETQTSGESNQKYPLWLQEKRYESNPLNFINSVKRKLQNAINSPKLCVDVGVQNSLVQSKLNSDTSQNKNEEIIEIFNQSKKSSKKSELKSYVSHKCLNLDQKTIENIELIPKKAVSENLITSKTYETESESDTSKNIPEISSESGTSLKKNSEPFKQNGTMGLDLEKLNSMKLNTHVDKSTLSVQLNKTQQREVILQPSKINFKPSNTKYDLLDPKIEKNKASVKIFSGSDQYTSDFQSGSQSIIIENSSLQKNANINGNNSDYHLLSDPQITTYLEKHSGAIPKTSDSHSKKTKSSNPINSEETYFKTSFRNITIRDNSRDNTNLEKKDLTPTDTSRSDISSKILTETEAKGSQSVYEKSQTNQSKSSLRSSKKSDKFVSLYTDSHPTASVSENEKSKSDSNMKYVNTQRGLHISSGNNEYLEIPPLKEPTLSLVTNNEKNENKLVQRENRNKLLKNISLRSDASKFADLNNTNEIHLKFEAEIHLLNDFNESLRQFSEVEKAFNTLKSKNDVSVAPNKVLQNRDTQTSALAKSPTTNNISEENVTSDAGSELSTINFSMIDHDSTSLNVNDTSKTEDFLNLTVNNSFSNFENLHSPNFAGMTLRMFEQLIKDEDARLENLKTILKIREQALLDRTKGELAWLEIQRKHLRETGKLHQASLIKKKQRGILVNHQKERHEMQRLKQMQKAASLERKIILKEQRNLIKHQLSTNKMLSKIKLNTPRERRHSGPLKVIQSHTESIRSEASVSKRSSSDKEAYSIMSHTQSIVSLVSEVSGDEVVRKTGTSRADFMDLAVKLPGDACEVPVSEIKRTLLIREAALQKRRKAAEELLQWHRKLLEEEKRITELESTANTIISQIPSTAPTSSDVNERYQFRGKQLNQLWFNLTSCKETKFNEDKIYPMSQIALERFCKSAREYSVKTKKLKRISDSEVSENSEIKTDDSASENIPDLKIVHSASIRTESEQSERSKTESVPITTANEYTSDFDIESLHEVVNIEDMDVVDQSINQLIDNFNKIQGHISLLGIKQSLKSNVEPEESIKSDKTDSDAEVSVIETAKTSKDKCFEEEELNAKNKVSSSSKNLSTLQDIVNNLSRDEKLCDTTSSNKLVEDENKSKSVEVEEIVTDVAGTNSMSEVSSLEISNMDKLKHIKSLDITEVPSLIDKNSLTENNLNKSQEILEELSNLEVVKDTPNKDSTTEENIQIQNKRQDNLSKSEEILLRLNQSENNSKITSKDLLQTEEGEEDSSPEVADVLLELQPTDNKISTVASSVQAPSKDETNEIINDLSDNENGNSIHDSQDVISRNKSSIIMDELSIKIDDSENIIFSNKSPLFSSRSKEKDDLLKSVGGKIDLRSEIVSEEPIKTNESGEAVEIAEELTINSAIDDLSKSSNKASSIPKNDHLAIKKELQEEKERSLKGTGLLGNTGTELKKIITDDSHSTQNGSKEMTDLLNGNHVSLIINRSNLSVDEISENDFENDKDAEGLSLEGNEKTEPKSINEITKDESIYEVIVSEATKITEDKEIDDYTSEDSKKGTEDSRSKSSKIIVSENILVEKSSLESGSINHEPQSILDIPSATEISEKSHDTSIPEIAPLSKEETNSYEEKELDSSRPITVSQSSIIPSEKEETVASEKSEISISEEKSPRSVSVDVKKRVSEIMAEASPVSRGDKCPKLQDFYTTTYDLVSPANSPELGSPTEEHTFLTAKSIFGTEAEELLRKQLAIEQEIKQITEQQQKEQLPYLFVREIPNKPPPPYTPPSSLPAANVITIIPTSDEIENITKYSAKILHKAYLSNNLENISISENTLSLISKDINKECYKFVFDLCKEIAKDHYKQFEKEECLAWLQVRKNPRLAVVKPLDVRGLEKHMNKKLKELFGYEKPMRRENAIIKWSRKKRDHVDEILVMESQAEETQWTNYDKDELLVMNEVTNEIMNMLLKETGEVVNKIFSKQTI